VVSDGSGSELDSAARADQLQSSPHVGDATPVRRLLGARLLGVGSQQQRDGFVKVEELVLDLAPSRWGRHGQGPAGLLEAGYWR
jgi:hypothetical protein